METNRKIFFSIRALIFFWQNLVKALGINKEVDLEIKN